MERSRDNHDEGLKGLDLCHRWISDCLHSENPEHHNSCRNHRARSQTALKRPSRLIQLSRGDDELSYMVCDYVPDQEPSPYPLYATVSHLDCTDNAAVTEELGLENVSSWTSTSQLPTCLGQAAQIALDAGVKCLWTPRLCANHTEDLITTAHIFAGGAFSIAVMNCVKSSDPLLSSGKLNRIPIVRPQWALEQTLAIYEREVFQNSVGGSPLCDSAFFYQGTLLSPATLYCGKDQLWWQCYHGRGALCSEALAMTGNYCKSVDNQEGSLGQLEPNEPYTREYYKSYANFDPQPSVSFSEAALSNRADFRGFESPQKCLTAAWTQIIAAYSITNTRTPEERVTLIDGIAECVPLLVAPGAADIFHSLSYAHGCWSADLVEQLAWHYVCDDVGNRRTLPQRNNTTNGFPSWSWLSLPGRVNFEFPVSTHPGIISTSMLPDEIFLSPVAKARFSTDEECSAIRVVTAGCVRACGSLVPAMVDVPTAGLDSATLQLEGLGRGYVKWDCRDEFDRALDGSDMYRAWPIYAHHYRDREVLGARGILLRRIQKDHCQLFVRCGWFEYQSQPAGEKSQGFRKIANFGQDEVALEEFIIT